MQEVNAVGQSIGRSLELHEQCAGTGLLKTTILPALANS
jgi:hypothetical protein